MPSFYFFAYLTVIALFIMRALLRPNREPSSRLAWVMIMVLVPGLGMIAYVFFGETNIGRERAARYKQIAEVTDALIAQAADTTHKGLPSGDRYELVARRHAPIFRTGQSISEFRPVGGNTAEVMHDSVDAIDRLVADIDAATDHVHVLFYIWLDDVSGLRVVEALRRAAQRGVTVRAMADDLGSRKLVRSEHWTSMERAGVRTARALPLGFLLLHPIRGRVDLRNHRKIVVIDNRITYCGSQNCADAAFRVKAKFAPWVDMQVRFEGPIAVQNQWLFVQDWMAHVDEDLRDLPRIPPEQSVAGGVIAQVNGTGPTVRASAMPEMFEALLHAARDSLTITTPYYVPTEAMQSSICAAAYRGVRVRFVVPKRNDSWIVAAASRSYYHDLLDAGVEIFEYPKGLLHTKSLVVDEDLAMIGSANLDRRSFELNYENNILFQHEALAQAVLARQEEYIADSHRVTIEEVEAWSVWRRLWNNTIAMIGPVL
ncbi:cardiolipin synthase [Pseudooceanicola sp. LIPI14-2-Ac024]|uniref:cardiolipin synthase n=1 Tax=Pseudooceanicola sp. LIPI14-2-Ac024 TaxID=3344875 RepID=UPI0035CFBF80